MRKMLTSLAAIAGVVALAAPANAAISVQSEDGPWISAGFAHTALFDFESGSEARFSGGYVASGSVGDVNAAPWEPTPVSNYYGVVRPEGPVAPGNFTPGYFDLTGLDKIAVISLYWGSVDTHNDLYVLDENDVVIATVAGASLVPANGCQGCGETNRLVTISFTDADIGRAAKLKFESTGVAFEFDNIAVLAVPEASTWMMMIAGMGLIGFSMRRKRNVAVSFA